METNSEVLKEAIQTFNLLYHKKLIDKERIERILKKYSDLVVFKNDEFILEGENYENK